MKKIIFALLLYLNPVFGEKIVITSVPKSGTHLLKKCIELIRGEWDDTCQWGHIFFEPDSPYISNLDYKVFFMYRDPRDRILSHIHEQKARCQNRKTVGVILEELLTNLEENFTKNFCFAPEYQGCKTYDDYYRNFFGWLDCENVYSCKFEDLIGEKGGGSDAVQAEVIVGIATHLGIDLTPEEVQWVADHLFGNTETFRKGKIGDWKEVFTEKHIELCQESMGETLIKLKYEELKIL